MDNKNKQNIQLIKNKLSKITGITAAYVYGSVIRKDFKKDSDIDVLLISKDRDNPVPWENSIRKTLESIPGVDADVTVIFESEYENGFHACWSNFYFLNVKRNNMLIKGKDVIKKFNDYKINFDECYRRIAWFCQRTRSIIMNNHYLPDEISFWEKKLRRWIPSSVGELLYLNGIFEPTRLGCMNTFFKLNKDFKHTIDIQTANISQLNEFLEELRILCFKMKKNTQIRKGVAVVLYKKVGKEIRYFLLQRQETMKGWEIVKGGLRKDETLEQAAIRETMEESGLSSFKFVKVLPYTFNYRQIHHGVLQERVYTLVLIEVLGNYFKVQKRFFKTAKYFSKNEALKRMIWPEFRESLEMASKSLEGIQ